MPIATPRLYGHLKDGQSVEAWTLVNQAGACLEVISYGGIVTKLLVPDRHGRLADVTLGFDRLEDYLERSPYFGAIVGRIAGRVPHGRLPLPNGLAQLPLNDGVNHIHGGPLGLDRRLWRVKAVEENTLLLTCRSPDGESGYPGNVDFKVAYTLTERNELVIATEASADCVTPVSLTHHSYFNLAGEGSGSIAGHTLQVLASAYVPVDARFTPLGVRMPVDGQPCDFRQPRRLAEALPQLFRQHGDIYHLRECGAPAPEQPTLAARLDEPTSGRRLEVHTNDYCLQFYSASHMDSGLVGKSGRPYGRHAGVCLECEGYPDAVAHPEFGDILVRPGAPQRRRTVYAFSTF